MVTSKRKFYKTVIQVTVLSEEPYENIGSHSSSQTGLSCVAYDIDEGDCSGQVEVISSDEVDGPTMAKLLQEQASDPEFFQLTEDGEDTDEFE